MQRYTTLHVATHLRMTKYAWPLVSKTVNSKGPADSVVLGRGIPTPLLKQPSWMFQDAYLASPEQATASATRQS